jgi:hypothetical protein
VLINTAVTIPRTVHAHEYDIFLRPFPLASTGHTTIIYFPHRITTYVLCYCEVRVRISYVIRHNIGYDGRQTYLGTVLQSHVIQLQYMTVNYGLYGLLICGGGVGGQAEIS